MTSNQRQKLFVSFPFSGHSWRMTLFLAIDAKKQIGSDAVTGQWCKQILILEWIWAETHVFHSDLDLKSHRPVSSMYNTRSNLSTPMSALSSTFIDRAEEEKSKDYLYIYIFVLFLFKRERNVNTHICHKASCGNHSLQWSRALSL